MAEYTAAALQAVPAGQNVLLTETAVPGCCNIKHREGAGNITLGGFKDFNIPRYRVTFNANIAVPTGGTVEAISIALAVDGEPLAASTAIVTPAAVEEFFNVSVSAIIAVPCECCATVAVENTSTQIINVQNANVIVEKI